MADGGPIENPLSAELFELMNANPRVCGRTRAIADAPLNPTYEASGKPDCTVDQAEKEDGMRRAGERLKAKLRTMAEAHGVVCAAFSRHPEVIRRWLVDSGCGHDLVSRSNAQLINNRIRRGIAAHLLLHREWRHRRQRGLGNSA